MMKNIVDIIMDENRGRRHRPAVSEGAKTLTYGELFDAVEHDRDRLEQQGVRPHDRVLLFCEDAPEYIMVSLAVLAAGAVVMPVSPSLSAGEVDAVNERMKAAWILCDDGAMPRGGGCIVRRMASGSAIRLHVGEKVASGEDAFSRCNPAFVRFSSGTTGASKGVVLSHEAIAERTAAADKTLRITPDDAVIWVLSMSFHFVVTILLFLRRGAEIMLCGHDFPAACASCISRGTLMYASPFHYHVMALSPDFRADMFASVRLALSTAMSLSANIAEQFERRFGLPLCQAYGIIEVGLPFIQVPGQNRKDGSVGTPGPDYEIKLMDRDTQGTGEILLRGPGMFSAYLSPWRTRKDLDAEGWFHTGDLGRMDHEGRLYIVGRKKEVINYAGMKIFPSDVERVLHEHRSVREAYVYGRPDDRFGELPAARIVPRGASPDEAALRRFCYARLPAYMVPKSFEFVDRIPRTASGKVRRV